MAREQAKKQADSDDAVDRRTYLRLSGAIAVGAATVTLGEPNQNNPLGNVLSIVGTSARPTTYEVTVTDEIVPGDDWGALSALGTTGRSAEDAVADGVRNYRFSGEIADLRVGDGAVAFVNGSPIGPDLNQ